MGYYKWRKILIILMIINILFVLFARFSKVFGYTYNDNILGSNITIPDTVLEERNVFYFIRTNLSGDKYSIYLIQTSKDATITYEYDENAGINYRNKFRITGKYINTSYTEKSKIDCIDYLNTMYSRTLSQTGNNTVLTFGDSVFNDKTAYFTNTNIKYYNSNNIAFGNSVYINPFFSNPTADIQNLAFNNIFIEPGSWDTSNPLYLHCLEITNIIDNGDNTNTYYYNDNIFLLDNKSKYYEQFFDTENYYFSVPKYNFAFNVDTSYLLVLNDTVNSYNNSIGLIDKDIEKNIFQSVLIDTSGKITAADTINDNISNIKDEMSNNTVSEETETELENSLHFDNKNEELENINNNFFSRLTTMISNLVGYDLGEDTTIKIPMPYSDKTISLHSNILYKNVTGALRVIINAFWFYLFSFYLYKFVNKLYIAISTGNILDTFSSEGEAITNNML